MRDGEVSSKALPKDRKEALDTYIEHQEDFRDMGNYELN